MTIDSIRKYSKNNLFNSIFLCIEIIFIVLLAGYSIFLPLKHFIIMPEDFFIDDSLPNMVNDSECLIFNEDDQNNTLNIGQPISNIASGGYMVNVEYSVEDMNMLGNEIAQITFTAEYPIDSSTIILDGANSSATGRFWVPTFLFLKDVEMKIDYNGFGTLEIFKVNIDEQYVYRFVRLFGFIVLFLIIDFIYYIIFINRNWIKNNILKFVGLCAILLSCIPLFTNFLFWGHDLDYQLWRIVSIATEMQNGQFPIRIFTSLNNGYGYITPLYYGSLFLYFPALLYNMMLPLRTCYQLFIFLISLSYSLS